jgi:transposase
MIRIDFTDDQIEALKYERYFHPHPRVQRKMEALLLKSQGLPHKQICQISGITANTLRQYLRDYIEGRVDKLKEINFRRPKSELFEHKETIEGYFRKHPPATVKEAIAKIHALTGIKRSQTQTRKFLKSIGMRLLKVGTVPAKADLDKQQTFKKNSLNLD